MALHCVAAMRCGAALAIPCLLLILGTTVCIMHVATSDDNEMSQTQMRVDKQAHYNRLEKRSLACRTSRRTTKLGVTLDF
jgi:hypothetical protein